jgi:hypothetical protein
MDAQAIKAIVEAATSGKATVHSVASRKSLPGIACFYVHAQQSNIESSLFMSSSEVSVTMEVYRQRVGFSLHASGDSMCVWDIGMKNGSTLLFDLVISTIDERENELRSVADGTAYLIEDNAFVPLIQRWCIESNENRALNEVQKMFGAFKDQANEILSGVAPDRYPELLSKLRQTAIY